MTMGFATGSVVHGSIKHRPRTKTRYIYTRIGGAQKKTVKAKGGIDLICTYGRPPHSWILGALLSNMKHKGESATSQDQKKPRQQKRGGEAVSCACSFVILNDHIVEHILSFLNNQTLTKLQCITGNTYPNCDPAIAKLCCRCENDNPAIFYSLCRECESKRESYDPNTTTAIARMVYGVQDFSTVSPVAQVDGALSEVYARVDVENIMLRTCGSKMGWFRVIAQLNGGIRRVLVQQHQAREDWKLFSASLAPGFESYVTPDGFNRSNKADFEESSTRFALVTATFKERGLQLRRDEPSSRAFVAQGVGTIECVAENAEELDFLIVHTDYVQRRDDKIKYYFPHESNGERSFALRRFRQCSDEVATELCAEYLRDAKGFVLPRKWEKCRSRFEKVQESELELQHKARYIYSGSVKQE